MKNKSILKNIVLISGISTIFLSACNSGSSTSQTATPPTESTPPTTGGDVTGSVLQFVGTEAADYAVNSYMQQNGITLGNLALNFESYPILNSLYQATGNGTNEILAGLASLSSQLQQDTLLLQVEQQQDYQSLMSMQLNIATQEEQLAVNTLINHVNGSYLGVASWLSDIDPGLTTPSMVNIFQGLVAESTFSTNQAQAMLKNVNTFPFNSTTTDANDSLEDGGFALGMDTISATYDWTQPISSEVQTQNVTNSFFNQQLKLQESAYTFANSFGNVNGFAFYKQWSDSLDVQYAQILNTLLQIGATDQIRVFLYANTPPKKGQVVPSIPSYIPSYHYTSLSNMESDVSYAMQYRISNLTMAIQQSKLRIYNYYVGTIASQMMSQSCGINQGAFLKTTESQVGAAIGSWNGSTLQAYCTPNNNSTLSTYNVSSLCTTATGTNPISTIGQGGYYTYPNMGAATNNYNLYVANGSISCGQQNWNATTFNSSQFTPNINTINELGTAGPEGQGYWNGVLTWGAFLPISSVFASTTSQFHLSQGATSIYTSPYNVGGNYNQSINIGGNSQSGNMSTTYLGLLIFDGIHSYMAVTYLNSPNGYANIGIQCLPNDNTCSFGAINGASYSLNFNNGDTLTISNNGSLYDSNYEENFPWFWINPNYSVLPTTYNYAQPQPGGTYSETCQNITWTRNGTTWLLSASCSQTNGNSIQTTLNYNAMCSGGSSVSNNNGVLTCDTPI